MSQALFPVLGVNHEETNRNPSGFFVFLCPVFHLPYFSQHPLESWEMGKTPCSILHLALKVFSRIESQALRRIRYPRVTSTSLSHSFLVFNFLAPLPPLPWVHSPEEATYVLTTYELVLLQHCFGAQANTLRTSLSHCLHFDLGAQAVMKVSNQHREDTLCISP